MSNVITFTATEARRNWFEILNMVAYEKKEARISKNNRFLVRIVRDMRPKKTLMDYAGCMSDKEARAMKKAIKELRKLPERATKIHKLT